ncbi:MAG: hypothetical protein SFU56_05285 [Capsulimonadales bacterium]|nr:hypothetical protein [Capsulimonadales bacterium]
MNRIRLANTTTATFNADYPSIGGRVHVPCQLFQAGEYPDKGVTVTEEELDHLILRFRRGDRAVPIRVEHIETPLDPLGHVVALHREGGFLYGTLAFPVGLYFHIRERKADRVSVGLQAVEDEYGRGYLLFECSLVFTPRVAGAGFLSPEQVAARLAIYRQQGKVTPAMEEPLAGLLALCAPPEGSEASEVTFGAGGGAELTAMLDALMDALPVVLPRGPAVPVRFHREANEPALSPEMERWARSMGLDPARVARMK